MASGHGPIDDGVIDFDGLSGAVYEHRLYLEREWRCVLYTEFQTEEDRTDGVIPGPDIQSLDIELDQEFRILGEIQHDIPLLIIRDVLLSQQYYQSFGVDTAYIPDRDSKFPDNNHFCVYRLVQVIGFVDLAGCHGQHQSGEQKGLSKFKDHHMRV